MPKEAAIPKSQWGDGPWQTEPDDERWIDEATNLPCWIRRAPVTGSLCGYVGVPRTHPAFGLPYDFDIDFDPHAPFVPFRPELLGDGPDSMFRRMYDRRQTEWLTVKERKPVQTLVNQIVAHGGLTYANHQDDSGGENWRDWWWYGFDCAHAGDLAPAMEALKRTIGMPERFHLEYREEYRTIAYVRAECVRLARQISDIAITVNSNGRVRFVPIDGDRSMESIVRNIIDTVERDQNPER